ncbi:hypothetical protein [Pseudoalteromonas sp. ASV78]
MNKSLFLGAVETAASFDKDPAVIICLWELLLALYLTNRAKRKELGN